MLVFIPEAYHLRREETDWFDKPRDGRPENGQENRQVKHVKKEKTICILVRLELFQDRLRHKMNTSTFNEAHILKLYVHIFYGKVVNISLLCMGHREKVHITHSLTSGSNCGGIPKTAVSQVKYQRVLLWSNSVACYV